MGLRCQRTRAATALAAVLAAFASGCGASPSSSSGGTPAGVPAALAREARSIGRGPRFHPPASGPLLGDCRRRPGARTGTHVELFASNRVVLVPAGIGAHPPVRYDTGRVVAARCLGDLLTLDPAGVVLIRDGTRATLADLFRSWGQPLTSRRMASFAGHVRVYIGGRRVNVDPRRVRLARHSEIVLEVGPYVPPHRAYRFEPGA